MKTKRLTTTLRHIVCEMLADPAIAIETKAELRKHHNSLTELLADIEHDERDAYEEAGSAPDAR